MCDGHIEELKLFPLPNAMMRKEVQPLSSLGVSKCVWGKTEVDFYILIVCIV